MRQPAVLATVAALAGCGGGDDGGERLRVSAATSLKGALTAHAGRDVSLSFGGSDQLAAQIRQGARPDVFAAADVELVEALHRDRLAEAPVVFATNELVLAVPAQDARVGSFAELERPGVKLAVGGAGVPAGEYAREVLTPRAARNIRSEEPDVAGVVGKVTQGAVDAGFVYATDVRASGGRLRAIGVPGAPPVRYAAAVVKPSERARAFVKGLKDAPALRVAGFGTP